MSLSVVFELDDDDLKHFQLIMKDACEAASGTSAEDIVSAAQDLLDSVGDAPLPGFIAERLDRLRHLIDMVQDHEWGLPDEDKRRVLNVLAYFCEHEDLIPDSIPGLGYLDDAIMIELATRELAPEIDAYMDFCEFRESESARRGVKAKSTDVTREDWLQDRREKLQKQMRKRRLGLGGREGTGGPFRLM